MSACSAGTSASVARRRRKVPLFSILVFVAGDAFGSPIRSEIERLRITESCQFFPGHGAAHAGMTVEEKYLSFVGYAARDEHLDVIEGHVDGVFEMSLVELGRSAH